MNEYKKLHSNERKIFDPILNPKNEFVLVKIGGITADQAGLREYNFN